MFDYLQFLVKVIYDRGAQNRLLGFRPVVICLLRKAGTGEFALVQPKEKYEDSPRVWIPPQEGIEPNELCRHAALRCISEELGIDPRRRTNYLRSKWIKRRKLPTRKGERTLNYSIRGEMQGKAYFAALIDCSDEVQFDLNRSEVLDAKWVDVESLGDHLKHCLPDKLEIIQKAFRQLCDIEMGDVHEGNESGIGAELERAEA